MIDFRQSIEKLEQAGELQKIKRPLDIRYFGALVEDHGQALFFEDVPGYDFSVVGGILGSPKRCAVSFGGDFSEISHQVSKGLSNPIDHVEVKSAPGREVAYQVGDEVDLYSLPIPVFAEKDGGQMITAAVIVAKDEDGSLNSGIYRLLVREKNLTGIDIVTPNDLRRIVERNTERNQPTPISINLGNHPLVFLAASLQTPAGVDELSVAGGMIGDPVSMARCETVDVPCIADSEIVMEAEVLPIGWTQPEGRFGEFHRSMGALHWNPQVRVKAIYTRKKPIYYALHMPWESIYLGPFCGEGETRRKLRAARIDVKDINITPGGSTFFHAVISIKARPGDGKIALMTALSEDFKHVVVVDDDVDVFDPLQVEWAIMTRFQADKDTVIISNVRAKPLDPSLHMPASGLATTAKMGLDATIPHDLPKERFAGIKYVAHDKLNTAQYLADVGPAVDIEENCDAQDLAKEIHQLLESGEPLYYAEIVKKFWSLGLRSVASALGLLHESGQLWQDDNGRLCLRNSRYAAVPPQ